MPDTTTVVACLGGDQTALQRRPVPEPGAGEMLLDLRVVGFCGTDLFKLQTGSAAAGSVLGHELVGTVSRLGDGVEGFSPGDRVVVPHHVPCGNCHLCRTGSDTMCATFRDNLMEPGGFADAVLIRSRAVAEAARRVPDAVSDANAVFMEPAACVLRGIDRSGIAAGGTAVIQGAGSMGLLHLLVLRAAVPDVNVVMVDPAADRREAAVRLGAAASAPPGDEARAAVDRISSNIGADAVFDTVGGAGPLEAGLAMTRQGGTVVLFAHAPVGDNAGFDLNDLFKYERRVIGTYSGAVKEQRAIFDLMCSGALDASALVTHTMPLDEFRTGLDLVVDRKALKVLFTPSREGAR